MPSDQKIEYRGNPLPGRRGSTTDLTEKQQRFVEYYLIDLNATQAAIRAGYSAKSAGQQGSAMLKNPKVAEAIAAGQAKRAEETGITQSYVVERLKIEAERTGEGSSHGARVSALIQLGKHTGGFADEHKHGFTPGQGRVRFVMELHSDD
jgi:hypothetical protein